MNIEKRPNGKYRARITHNGKVYRKTFDRKPTKSDEVEFIKELSEREKKEKEEKDSFKKCAENYIKNKRNVLSPKTIKEYKSALKNLPEWFCDMRISDITQSEINILVNELSEKNKPKTIRNKHGFVSAVLSVYAPEFVLRTKLPQKEENTVYVPSTDDIKRIVDYVKGDEQFEIPILLACYGLRRSEICALTIDDLDGTTLKINKAVVSNDKNEFVEKTTKTESSAREIEIGKYLADLIRERGYIYQGHPGSILKHLHMVQRKLGIEKFPLHKMRHYFASKMLTITDKKTVQKMGGWKTSYTMDKVYAHSLKEEEEKAKKAAVKLFDETIFNAPE